MKIGTKTKEYLDFENWLNETNFIKRNGGWMPKPPELWFYRVENSHKNLKKFLKGNYVQRHFQLESQQRSLSDDEISPFFKDINNLVPNYAECGYDERSLALPLVPVNKDGLYDPNASHRVLKVPKNIKQYAEIYYRDNGLSIEERTFKMKELDKVLSKLGEAWGKARTSQSKLEATLSINAKAFVLLGHYGPDKDSCWRQGSSSPYDKYIVGQTPNTFVITISKYNDLKKKDTNVARCIGFFDSEFKICNLANYYFTPGFAEGDGLFVIQKLIEDIWQDEATFHEGKVLIKAKGYDFYHNEYGNWTFTKGKNSKLNMAQLLVLETNCIIKFECPKCHERDFRSDEGWEIVDDEYVCRYCAEAANICEISEIKTFIPLIPVIGDDGFELMVHPNVAKEYSKCYSCGKYHTCSSQVSDKGELICSSCIEKDFSECDKCGKLVKDEEILDIGSDQVCKDCADSQNLNEIIEVINAY